MFMQLRNIIFLLFAFPLLSCKVSSLIQEEDPFFENKSFYENNQKIEPSFVSSKNGSFYIILNKEPDCSDAFTLKLILKGEKKALNDKSKLTIVLDKSRFFSLYPINEGKIVAYSIDPYFVEDEICYKIDKSTLNEIYKSQKTDLFLTLKEKIISAKLNFFALKQIGKFVLQGH